ncbi:MAG: hypothetical protein AB7O96_13985 [Pseudobdellovibrionaceae bacterium]
MNKIKIVILIWVFAVAGVWTLGAKENTRPHSESEKESKEYSPPQSDHKDHEEHEHEEGGEHGEAESSNIGPNKGITEADERDGFRLSPEAIKNFELKTVDVSGAKIIKLAKSAIFFGKEEKNIYRLRAGFYKRLDFKTLSRSDSEYTIECKDLEPGDKVVVNGLGFLRIAEMAAFGGVAEGHSH